MRFNDITFPLMSALLPEFGRELRVIRITGRLPTNCLLLLSQALEQVIPLEDLAFSILAPNAAESQAVITKIFDNLYFYWIMERLEIENLTIFEEMMPVFKLFLERSPVFSLKLYKLSLDGVSMLSLVKAVKSSVAVRDLVISRPSTPVKETHLDEAVMQNKKSSFLETVLMF